jgi:hypothetical protein
MPDVDLQETRALMAGTTEVLGAEQYWVSFVQGIIGEPVDISRLSQTNQERYAEGLVVAGLIVQVPECVGE